MYSNDGSNQLPPWLQQQSNPTAMGSINNMVRALIANAGRNRPYGAPQGQGGQQTMGQPQFKPPASGPFAPPMPLPGAGPSMGGGADGGMPGFGTSPSTGPTPAGGIPPVPPVAMSPPPPTMGGGIGMPGTPDYDNFNVTGKANPNPSVFPGMFGGNNPTLALGGGGGLSGGFSG